MGSLILFKSDIERRSIFFRLLHPLLTCGRDAVDLTALRLTGQATDFRKRTQTGKSTARDRVGGATDSQRQPRTHAQKAGRQPVEFRTTSVHGHQVGGNTWYRPSFMVRPAGIEPATPAFGGQYSIH